MRIRSSVGGWVLDNSPRLTRANGLTMYMAAVALLARRTGALELPNCSVMNAVQLADDKLVAHVDCKSGEDATRVVLEKFMSVDGIVQTNIIAVVCVSVPDCVQPPCHSISSRKRIIHPYSRLTTHKFRNSNTKWYLVPYKGCLP